MSKSKIVLLPVRRLKNLVFMKNKVISRAYLLTYLFLTKMVAYLKIKHHHIGK